MRSYRKRQLGQMLCLWLLILPLSACFGGATPADELANANYEISGLIGDAQQAVLKSLQLRVLKPDDALAAGGAIEKVNLMQQKLLEQLVLRLQEKDGKESLVITEGDKSQLIAVVNLLSETASEIVRDPAILRMDSATRGAVTAALLAVRPLVIRFAALLQKTPTQKRLAPSLRQQLERATDKAEARRKRNDGWLAALQAEVAR